VAAADVRIGIDGTPLLGVRTGVGAVVAGLVDELATRPDVEIVAYAVTGRSGLVPPVPAGVQTGKRRLPARVVRWLWERTDTPRVEYWTGPVDVVHATNYVAPPSRVPVVVSVYDLTFVHFPEMCTPDTLRYPRLLRRALARGAHVHVTSEFVRQEIVAELGVEPARVACVYPGLPSTAGGDAQRGRRLAGSDGYVLALGTIEPRKNLPRLVRAFDGVAASHPDLALVVAGPPGWGSEALEAALDTSRASSRIRRLGYVSDDDRRDLLAGARAFAYPSVYEGFGFPPLEAMAAGVPVLAGIAGSLPEVLGDAAVLVDPYDVDAIAGALVSVSVDETRRAELVARGTERVRRYTWPRTADEMLGLYRSLL
jgi:glycosyltransferase involved in cell wall biosynthesis